MISIVTDVHAHLQGLTRVVEEIRGIEAARHNGRRSLRICLGDVLDAGPNPKETLDLLEKEFDIFLRGNHEDYVFAHLKDKSDSKYLDPLWKMVPWALKTLGDDRVNNFQQKCRFNWATEDGFYKFFHASPESNSKSPPFFPADPGVKGLILSDVQSMIVVGHTHYFGAYFSGRQHWINAGSVGYPFLKNETDSSFSSFVTLHEQSEITATQKERRNVEVNFHTVAFERDQYLKACLQTGFLEECLPFSVAIICQTVFNRDITFPFFKAARRRGIVQQQMPRFLVDELFRLGYVSELEAVFKKLGTEFGLSKALLSSV